MNFLVCVIAFLHFNVHSCLTLQPDASSISLPGGPDDVYYSNVVSDSIDFDDYDINVNSIESEPHEVEFDIDNSELHEENVPYGNSIKEITIQVSPKGVIETTRLIGENGIEKIEVKSLDSHKNEDQDNKEFADLVQEIINNEFDDGHKSGKAVIISNSLAPESEDNSEAISCAEDQEKVSPSPDNEIAKDYISKRYYDGPKVTVRDIPTKEDLSFHVKDDQAPIFSQLLLIFLLTAIALGLLRLTGFGKHYAENSKLFNWLSCIYQGDDYNERHL